MAKKIVVDKTKKKQKEQLAPIRCKGCKAIFTPKDKRERFHSANCRESYYQRTYFGKQSVRKVCPNDGVTFVTSKPGRQVYCCPECREEHRHKQKEGVLASVSAERKTYLGERYAVLEAAGFKCALCGRGAGDGVRLDVEDDGKGGFRAVCNECVEGREFNKEDTNA